MTETVTAEEVHLSAAKIGGIDSTDVKLRPGVTILEGRNATNRTSLLQAIMAALGSQNVSLKGDAEEGSVELSMNGETYTRQLERADGTIATQGNPYLDDSELADLFAFLLESNEARRAVARGDDFRDIIMRPVDTAAIQSEIQRLEDEKRKLDDELSELESLKGDLPELEQERNQIESRIEEKRGELERKEEELASADADIEETRQEKEELEDKLTELRETRSDLEDVRFSIETEEESLESLRQEREELEAEATEVSETSMGDIEEIEARISRLREQKQNLDSEVNELQSTIQFNETRLEEASEGPLSEQSDEGGPVTDQLLADNETVTCWTCGSSVERDQIESTLDQLRDQQQEKLETVRSLDDQIQELADEKRDLEKQQQRREEIERRLDRIDEEIDERREKVDSLRERREALTDEIGELETAIDSLEEQEYSEVLDLHKEANQLEFELGRLEGDLEDVDSRIADIEDRLAEQEEIETERSEIQSELADLRTRIDQIEQQAVEQFNDHIETVLDILDYENLERIWIERTEREVREGRRKVSETVFDLHIVRQSDAGTTYEDTVDHLSESEREVTGLIFALAGYLVHDVHEQVPFILLDSLESIDSQRISTLIDYLREYVDYLVVALLPEDAAALDAEYQRVNTI